MVDLEHRLLYYLTIKILKNYLIKLFNCSYIKSFIWICFLIGILIAFVTYTSDKQFASYNATGNILNLNIKNSFLQKTSILQFLSCEFFFVKKLQGDSFHHLYSLVSKLPNMTFRCVTWYSKARVAAFDMRVKVSL